MSGHEQERLSAYLDAELPPEEMAAVAAHLAACAECAARLAEFAAVDEAAAALAAHAPSGYFDTLPSRLRARLAPRPAARRLPAWTWAAAAALLLAVVTPLALQQRPEAGRAEREAPAAAPPAAMRPAEPTAPAAPAPTVAPAAAAVPAPEPLRQAKLHQAPAGGGAAPGRTSNAAPAQQPEKTEPEFARAPAEADLRAPAAPAAHASAQADVAREAAGAPKDELARAREESAATAGDKAAGVPAEGQVQAAPAAKAARSQAPGRMAEAFAGAPASATELDWSRLQAARPQTPAEWRRLREELRRFADGAPQGPHAQAARLRTIEAGFAAWRAGGDAADEAVFRRDAAAYLERDDAPSKPRVRELLAQAPPAGNP